MNTIPTAPILIPSERDEDDADLIDHVTRGVNVRQPLAGEAEEPLRGPPKSKR